MSRPAARATFLGMKPTSLLFSHSFQRRPLDTLLLDGQPVWAAGLVGDALGYAHQGSRLCTLIRTDWADDFVPGEHFHYLTGARLGALKRAVVPCDSVSEFAAHLLLLTAKGVERVLLKSDKPARVGLRRLFEEEVLPLAAAYAERLGASPPHPPDPPSPERTTTPRQPEIAGIFLVHGAASATQPPTREERLADVLDLRERIFRSRALRETVRVLHAMDLVDDTVRAVYEVRAAEIALGEELPDLRPEPADRWYTVTDIARATGMAPAVIGRVISAMGIRGAPGLSRQVVTTTPDDDKTVFAYVYNERARGLILAACGGNPPGEAA